MSADCDGPLPLTGLVIVVEDESLVRMLLEESLREMGFAAAGFDNASSALEHLINVKGECVLIIADQGLPGGIQGAEFIGMVKEKWPSIPSVITSGYLLDEGVIPPYSSWLSKPYTLVELEETIDRALNR